MAGERRRLLRPEVARPVLPVVHPEAAVDPHVVVLLLLHGSVVGGLGEAEVVVGDPLAAKGIVANSRLIVASSSLMLPAVASSCRNWPGGAGLVELAARAVGAVEVGVADQIWSKALLK